MPIQKELTHDCVRLLGAQMSYQYVGLIFSELNLMLPRATFKFHSWDFCALNYFADLFSLRYETLEISPAVFVRRRLWILMEATQEVVWIHNYLSISWQATLSLSFFFLHWSLPLLSLYFLWSFCWEIYLWTHAQSKDFCLSFCSA